MSIDQSIKKLVLADGAMGTALRAVFPAAVCPDELNLTEPDAVRALHAKYLAAGAQILQTNTFNANGLRWQNGGFAGDWREVAKAGVKLAQLDFSGPVLGSLSSDLAAQNFALRPSAVRSADSSPGHPKNLNSHSQLWGTLGPAGFSLEKLKSISTQTLAGNTCAAAEVLITAGSDAIVLETQYAFYELQAVVPALCSLNFPLVVSVTAEPNGTLPDGAPLGEVAAFLNDFDLAGVGLNCSYEPNAMLAATQVFFASSKHPRGVRFSAGLPPRLIAPKVYADQLNPFLSLNLSWIGGCCGTTPDFIAELDQRINHC